MGRLRPNECSGTVTFEADVKNKSLNQQLSITAEGAEYANQPKYPSRSARAVCRRHGGGRAGGRTAAATAQHRLHHGRRHRLVQHRRLPPGHHGGPDAEPRPAGRRGHAVHRLLRRGELHGGPGQLHHRRAADPHRPDHRRPGRLPDRHAGRGADHRHGAEVDGLRHRPVRQEPSGRPERVPADGARLRRVLRLPLSPRRDGGPVPSQLPAGAQGQGRPAQHGPQLGDRHRRPDGAAALGQDRQAEDRGRRRALSRSAWRRSTTRSSTTRFKFIDKAQQGRQAVLPLAQPDAHARRHAPLGQVREHAQLGERLVRSRKPAWRSSTTSSARS